LFSSASLTTHGGGGAFTYNLDNFVTAVPEPSSLFLIGTIAAAPVARRFAKRWRGSEK
jgi:PEP-CTERM motif